MSKIAERNLTEQECKKIEILRGAKGISRSELAKRINISVGYLYRIEKAQRCGVGFKILRNIADELGTNISVICNPTSSQSQAERQVESFEAAFLGNRVIIAGNELNEEGKIQAYNILKTVSDPGLTRAKKIERVMTIFYKH